MRPSLARPALVLLGLVAGLAAVARAQRSAPAGRDARADSLSELRHARDAQERFERLRQMHLPQTHRVAVRCDVRVGRYCYGYDESDELPPDEPPRIRSAREALLAELARRAERIPGDAWLAGQRVRYLVEAGRAAEAVAVADGCRSDEPGWCASLAGLALHAGGQTLRADSAFAAALGAMADDERCEWSDMSPLLAGELHRRYRATACRDRAALEERIWWLARPFLASAGNELRTEHYARLTTARLYDQARNPYNPSWGRDAREVLVRYGSPAGWSRDRFAESHVSGGAGPRITGYEPSPSYYFFPALRAVEAPENAEPDDWSLRDPMARARYALPETRRLADVESQVALFRRGDSTLAAVAYAITARQEARVATFAGAAAEVALALARDERTPPVIARTPGGATRGTLTAVAPWRPTLVAVEATSADGRGAARDRRGTGAASPASASGVALSDVLLLDGAAEPPGTLADALPRALPSVRLRRPLTVGLFWEVYGLAGRTEAVSVSLAVNRERASWKRRWGESLRLARRPAPVRLRWDARPDDPRQVGTGGVTLGVAELSPGTYAIEVTLRTPAGDSARAVRRVVIER